MLRITIHEDAKVCRLEFAGRLEGPWVSEAEKVWRASLCAGQPIEVDLRQLTAVDGAGRELLATIHLAGAHLIVEGVWMTALIEDLTGSRVFKDIHGQVPRKNSPARSKLKDQENSK
jgi:hypothetical protein